MSADAINRKDSGVFYRYFCRQFAGNVSIKRACMQKACQENGKMRGSVWYIDNRCQDDAMNGSVL